MPQSGLLGRWVISSFLRAPTAISVLGFFDYAVRCMGRDETKSVLISLHMAPRVDPMRDANWLRTSSRSRSRRRNELDVWHMGVQPVCNHCLDESRLLKNMPSLSSLLVCQRSVRTDSPDLIALMLSRCEGNIFPIMFR